MYTLVEEGGRGTYLAYKLEVPETPGIVQEELRIFPQARFHLSMKVSSHVIQGLKRGGPRAFLFQGDVRTCYGISADPLGKSALVERDSCERVTFGAPVPIKMRKTQIRVKVTAILVVDNFCFQTTYVLTLTHEGPQ